MYEALGDATAQDKIREKYPDQPHCRFLRESPLACVALPSSVDPDLVGKKCPSNPFHKHRELIGDLKPRLIQIQRANHLLEEIEMGIKKVDGLSLSDLEILRVTREITEDRRRKLLAKEIALQLSEIFGERKR
jgi:hypothetical protein